MNIRKWLFLFFTTAILGGLSIIITALAFDWEAINQAGGSVSNTLAAGIWLFFVGLSFSVLSQMGFFSYLLLHRLALSLFKSHALWNKVQIVIILFVLFDWIYLRYSANLDQGISLLDYVWLPVILLVGSTVIAYLKAQQTNQGALIPALFFMFVITSIESLPALTTNDSEWVRLMVITIFICNTWQLLLLHRLTGTGKVKSA